MGSQVDIYICLLRLHKHLSFFDLRIMYDYKEINSMYKVNVEWNVNEVNI